MVCSGLQPFALLVANRLCLSCRPLPHHPPICTSRFESLSFSPAPLSQLSSRHLSHRAVRITTHLIRPWTKFSGYQHPSSMCKYIQYLHIQLLSPMNHAFSTRTPASHLCHHLTHPLPPPRACLEKSFRWACSDFAKRGFCILKKRLTSSPRSRCRHHSPASSRSS